MAVDPIVLALACFGRVYCGLDAEEALMVAEKTVAVAGKNADAVDLLDAFDDVWAASLTAGTIHEGDTTPVHPLSLRDHWLNSVNTEEDREHIMLMPDDEIPAEPPKPARYRDANLVASIRPAKRKRRKWDKSGGQ